MNNLVKDREGQSERILPELTKNDRFAAVLVVLVAVTALGLGFIFRQRSINETWLYSSREAGIEARYPANWLLDERGDYVVRMQDPKARPFKTQYIVTVMPAGGETTVRNILDILTIQRAINLPAYRILGVEQIGTGGLNQTQMHFAFVEADPNPFVQRVPIVVLGTDFVILDGDRVIIVTYMSDETSFKENLPAFQRFFASLRY